MRTSKIKKALLPSAVAPDSKLTLSSGVTVLNVHLTGTATGGYRAGKYYVIVGDSSAGKTWLVFSAFAEAKASADFAGYRLIYDPVEDGADFDVARYFGEKVAEAVESPTGEPGGCSFTVEDFDDNLRRAMDEAEKTGIPFIYALDSTDGLTSADDELKAEDQRKAREKGTKTSGSYGMSKAKRLKSILRHATSTNGLRKTGSILIVLCQTIDNVGFGFEDKTRSGGNAITFFATADLWLSVKKTLTKAKVRGKDRPIGIETKVVIKKNRVTGKKYEKTGFVIYHSVGIDDIGSSINYLLEEGYWKKSGSGIVASGISDDPMGYEDLVHYIEENNLEGKLRVAVKRCYREIAEAVAVVRKKRYE